MSIITASAQPAKLSALTDLVGGPFAPLNNETKLKIMTTLLQEVGSREAALNASAVTLIKQKITALERKIAGLT